MLLTLARTGAAQDERRVPAPRVDPGLVLQRDTQSDRGPTLEPLGDGRLRHNDPRFTAIIAADGEVEFRDVVIELRAKLLGLDLFKGKLDPPKPIARDNVEERALYPHGLPTAPTVVGIGGGFGNVLGAWRDASLPLAERRRRIFVLWDECAEPGEPGDPAEPGDEIRAEAASEARRRIETLVRRLAPPGSAQQFTAAELREFNAGRQSRARFDPYASGKP